MKIYRKWNLFFLLIIITYGFNKQLNVNEKIL